MTFVIVTSFLAILFTTAFVYVQYLFSYWKRQGVPFIEPSIPFGNCASVIRFRRSFGQNLHDLYNKSSTPFSGIYVGPRPALLVRDPKIIRDIFIKDFQYFWHRGFHYDHNVDLLSENLFSQSGDKWREMRAKLSPAFTSGKLRGMVETMVDCGKKLEDHLDEYGNSGKEIEVREIFTQFTTNVIASVGFGLDVDCLKNPHHEFREYGGRFFEPLIKNSIRFNISYFSPFLTKLFGVRFVDKDVSDFMTKIVRQNLEYRETNNVVRKDFFQLLLQLRNTGKLQEDDDNWSMNKSNAEKTLSINDLTAQAYVFFIAGFESTSTTMSFCLHELAKEPSVQQKVYDEIKKVLEKYNGILNYEALGEMRLLECCIDETLRLHPPFDVISRECTRDYKIAGNDIIIRKGTPILISITGPQYDPQYYDQPEKFIPERFIDDQTANKNSLNMPYLAFGDGPRNCIGMRLGKLQSKIGVCILLRKFSFELGIQHKGQTLVLDPKSGVRAPINGINLKIKPR